MATITPTKIKPIPATAPGMGVADVMNAGVIVVEGPEFNYNDTSPAALFEVPANCVLVDLWIEILTVWNGTGTVTLGDDGDTDRFMTSAEIAPTVLGSKSMKKGAQPGAGGFEYTTGNTIDATLVVGTSTQGTAKCWGVFRQKSHRNFQVVP